MKKFGEKSEKGFAILESIVFLVAFMIVAVYTIDFFSAIHTGVVGSIHSRTYLFETLRHRADIDALRPETEKSDSTKYFATDKEHHERFHVVENEDQAENDNDGAQVVARALTRVSDATANPNGTGTGTLKGNPTSVLYIKSGYGICTDSQCRKDGG